MTECKITYQVDEKHGEHLAEGDRAEILNLKNVPRVGEYIRLHKKTCVVTLLVANVKYNIGVSPEVVLHCGVTFVRSLKD